MQIRAADARYLRLDYVDENKARDPEFFEQMTNPAKPVAVRLASGERLHWGAVVRW
jgi:hypothetical protein